MPKDLSGTWRISGELEERLLRHAHKGRIRKLKKNELLYDQDDISSKFYYVRDGMIEVTIIKIDGAEIILELMGPHTICGEGAAFDNQPRFSRARAIKPTTTIEFDADTLVEEFRNDPDFAIALLRVVSLKQRVLAVRLEHLTFREPESRLMELFSRLSEVFADKTERGLRLKTYLTHEQIAAMTGTSRVTVTRAIQRLRQQGEIDIEDGRILIRRPPEAGGPAA